MNTAIVVIYRNPELAAWCARIGGKDRGAIRRYFALDNVALCRDADGATTFIGEASPGNVVTLGSGQRVKTAPVPAPLPFHRAARVAFTANAAHAFGIAV